MDSTKFEEIEEICQAALELLPEKRSAFLEESCGEDIELREEIQSLLSFEKTSDEIINQTPDSLAAEMFSEMRQVDFDGKEIGNYKIISQIGKGGMGTVYLARDKILDRQIAIKFLVQKFSHNKERLRRFMMEAKTASGLNHPNIITIHEIAEIDNHHYIATEFIEGETLRKRLKSKPLKLLTGVEIAIQIASALNVAHEAGIIHRDIKPDNIMIRPDGLVKILDFGIAKLSEQKIDFDSKDESTIKAMTKPGVIIGTANYMSPEQARGKKVDAQTDIFSLGIVLYLMFTGKLPFEGETPSDIIASLLKETPKPLDEYNEEFPKELKKIVEKALEKEKENRYKTSAEILKSLKQFKKQFEESEEIDKPIEPNKLELSQTQITNFKTENSRKRQTEDDLGQVETSKNIGNYERGKKKIFAYYFRHFGCFNFIISRFGVLVSNK